MYQAKQNGRNNVQMYHEGMSPYAPYCKLPEFTPEA